VALVVVILALPLWERGVLELLVVVAVGVCRAKAVAIMWVRQEGLDLLRLQSISKT
jgi:hypothetical protein